jgi:N-methylhydantoinase A/oxoprolinase/acetone carboxylase beta subunit
MSSPVQERDRWGLGVDIGGTFTDLALLHPATGRVHVGKVLTNHTDLAAGITDGVARLITDSGVDTRRIGRVVHGTTLATNALIERRGARTALIVTRGFRDLLEMGRESRFDIYDLELEIPAPLVPRHRVLEVTERMDATGAVVTPLDKGDVAHIAQALAQQDIGAVAICLLHAFRNSQHEREIAAILKARLAHLAISLSSEVMPDIREYERASTTVANAYVQPTIRRYLGRLSNALSQQDVHGTLHIMGSDGGTLSTDAATRFPVRIIESGPAGGATACAHFGDVAGCRDVIGFDMGGTTAKFCIIENARPARATAFEVGRVYRFARGSGLPIRAPTVEMIEIGAGGGSIAHVEDLGSLKVGPASAGALPGPVCYGQGGTEPTVTDADLVLGYLDPDGFLGGRLKLDRARAEKVISERIAKPLGLSTLRAAWGIHEIVNDNMARAAKVHCMERGKDPRRFALVAYGGAGPVHGYRLALALRVTRIIYPRRAGVMSAVGFLMAPPSFELVRSYTALLASADLAAVNSLLDELERETGQHVRSAGVAEADIIMRREASIRYAGQSFDLSVLLPEGKIGPREITALGRAFVDLYSQRYHRTNPDVPLELVSLRALAQGPRSPIPSFGSHAEAQKAFKGTRPVFMPEAGELVECTVYDRAALRPGATFPGPAIVEEDESTAVIGRDGVAEIDAAGNLLVTIAAASARQPSLHETGKEAATA